MSFKEKIDIKRRYLIERSELWQYDLLTPQKLRQYTHERNVNVCNYRTIEELWFLGFIRADIVASMNPLSIEGLSLIRQEQEGYLYLDSRKLVPKNNGYGGSFSSVNLPQGLKLLFHPYRYFVLHHIQRVFQSRVSSTQFLSSTDGWLRITQKEIEFLNEWTAKIETYERFNEWNQIAEIAIILEPFSYVSIHKKFKCRFPYSFEEIKENISSYRGTIKEIMHETDLDYLEYARQELCTTAEMIDSNKSLHVLLRLSSSHVSENLKGAIAGSLLLLLMSETIRRATENCLNISLPEEDQLGFGQWMEGGRKLIYGSERVLDAPKTELREFLAECGIDYGTKVRCYVEGETELGALEYALKDLQSIEIINLAGQVVEKNGKGVAFRDSLKRDLNAKVFSYCYIDSDREDFIRVVRKAATGDILSGGFFLSNPDIEFANFSLEELVEIAVCLSKELNVEIPDKSCLLEIAKSANNASQFFSKLQKEGVDKAITKGEAWGRALMKYALEHSKKCQMIEVARQLQHASTIKFQYSRDRYSVDPQTGVTRKRDIVLLKNRATS